MPEAVIIVAGLGRCGTSLVMQMLAAAKVPTLGAYPAFEDDINMRLPDLDAQREFYERCPGRAVKLIDPHLHAPPFGLDYRCIFLTRNTTQQARSILKLVGVPNDRRARRAMEASVRQDTSRARAAVERIGSGRFLQLGFEELIHDPAMAASRIALWAGVTRPHFVLDAMARVVRRRPAACLPYLMELEMIP